MIKRRAKYYCYISRGEADKRLAVQCGLVSRKTGPQDQLVALYRGMYDSYAEEQAEAESEKTKTKVVPVLFDSIPEDQQADKLTEFISNLRSKERVATKLRSDNTAERIVSFNRFIRKKLQREAVDTAIYIIDDFISKVVHLPGNTLTREDIVNGVKDANGKLRWGLMALYENLYRQMEQNMQKAYEEDRKDVVNNYLKILTHFNEFTAVVTKALKDREGYIIDETNLDVERADYSSYDTDGLVETYIAEEAEREHWMDFNDRLSAWGNLPATIRSIISKVPKSVFDSNGNLIWTEENAFGTPKTLDPMSVKASLETLARHSANSEKFWVNMQTSRDPNIESIVAYIMKGETSAMDLSEEKQQMLSGLWYSMRKNNQLYSKSRLSTTKDYLIQLKTILLNKIQDNRWRNNYSSIVLGQGIASSIFSSAGVLDMKKVKQLIKNEALIADKALRNRSTPIATRSRLLRETLELLGIKITKEQAMQYLEGKRRAPLLTLETNISKFVKAIKDWGIDQPINITQFLVDPTQGQDTNMNANYLEKVYNSVAEYLEHAMTTKVKEKNSKGQTITYYSDVIPSFLGDFADTIESYIDSQDFAGLKSWLKREFGNDPMMRDLKKDINDPNPGWRNWWIAELYNSSALNPGFAAQFKITKFLGQDTTEFEELTSKQHLLNMIELFYSNATQGNPGYATYPSFILGDANVQKTFTAKTYSKEKILEGLYAVFLQERQRMTQAIEFENWCEGQDIKGNKNFTDNAHKFVFLSFLNDIPEMTGKDTPPKEDVMAAIEAAMNEKVEKFKQRLTKEGLLDRKESKKGESAKYKYKIFNGAKDGNKKSIAGDELIEYFYWNTKFATIQQLQLMSEDISWYDNVKDLQKRYKEIHAPGSVLDLTAKINGKKFLEGRSHETAVYFKDIAYNMEELDPEFMKRQFLFLAQDKEAAREAIKEGLLTPKTDADEEKSRISRIKNILGNKYNVYKQYTKSTLTDGQGYRSLDSYRKVMGMSNKWTQDMENAYNEIQRIRQQIGDGNATTEMIERINDLRVVFQPIKPYTFTKEEITTSDGKQLKIPVQHKYAEAIIIPEILPKGSKLRVIGEWMKDNDVDLVCSTKCVKVGAFGEASVQGSSLEGLTEGLNKAYIHKLSYKDYRIQTNVPEHIYQSRLFGTQTRKIIMEGLDIMKTYDYFGGRRIQLQSNTQSAPNTGYNVLALYNSLIVANIISDFERFSDQVKDVKAVKRLLRQNVLNSATGVLDNLMAYADTEDDSFILRMFDGELSHDSEAMLLSIFKKMVNKQTILGGSAVQVSEYGISASGEDSSLRYIADPNHETNILYGECEIPWEMAFSYVDDEGHVQSQNLKFSDWCNADGTLILEEKEITQEQLNAEAAERNDIPRSINEYLSWKKGDKIYRPKIEKEFPGILDIIAYRIPTERHYSIQNLKIVKFSPKINGGTIKVPIQGTTIAGFDFDVDKLYFMRKAFKTRNIYHEGSFTRDENYDIFARIYDNHPDIHEELSRLRDEYSQEHKGKRTLESFWDEMLQQNPSWASDPYYDKNSLFQEAAEQLIAEGELTKPETTKEEKLNTYRFDKLPLENSRQARDNMILHIMRMRLMDPETFESRFTPGGFENAKRAALEMRIMDPACNKEIIGKITTNGKIDLNKVSEYADKAQEDPNKDPEPYKDPSDPETIIDYNQQNQIADKLIGIFANNNVNAALASTLATLEISTPIRIGRHTQTGLKNLLSNEHGVDIALNCAELLAASVDAVKDPVLIFLNLNTLTASSGALLARLGYSMREIGLFLNQPIIKQIVNDAMNSPYGRNLERGIEKVMASKAYQDVAKDFENIEIEEQYTRMLTEETLAQELQKGEDADKNIQYAVMQQFLNCVRMASALSQFIKMTKFTAANSFGSTMGSLIEQQYAVQEFADMYSKHPDKADLKISVKNGITGTISSISPINSDDTLLGLDKQAYMDRMAYNPFAYEQAMYDMARKALNKMHSYYPYWHSDYSAVRDYLNSLCPEDKHLSEDEINNIHREYLMYQLAQTNSLFSGEKSFQVERGGKVYNYTVREYYKYVFPRDFAGLRNATFSNGRSWNRLCVDYPILGQLAVTASRIQPGVPYFRYSIKMFRGGTTEQYEKEEFLDNIEDMLSDEDPKVQQLAGNLFFYNYYQNGFNFSPEGFIQFMPVIMKVNLAANNEFNKDGEVVATETYSAFLNKIMDPNIVHTIGTETRNEMAKMFILNHPDSWHFVSQAGASSKVINDIAKNGAFTIDIEDRELDEALRKDGTSLYRTFVHHVVKNEDNQIEAVYFKPVIAITKGLTTRYFMADSHEDEDEGFTFSRRGVITYHEVFPIGKSGEQTQYFATGTRNWFAIDSDQEAVDADKHYEDPLDISAPAKEETLYSLLNDEQINALLDKIFPIYMKGLIKAGQMESIDVEENKEAYREALRAALKENPSEILKAANEASALLGNTEVWTLDEDGNTVKMC